MQAIRWKVKIIGIPKDIGQPQQNIVAGSIFMATSGAVERN